MKYCLCCCGLIITLFACNSDPEPQPLEPCLTLPTITVKEIIPATNCTSEDGQVSVQASGNRPFTFKIGDNDFQADSTFTNLASGNYNIIVSDSLGCETSTKVNVGNTGSVLSIVEIVKVTSGCEMANGQATIMAAGEGEIRYKLNNGAFQTNNVFTNLTAEVYTITITDDSGCTLSDTFEIKSGVSFSGQVAAIFSADCNIPTCHNGTNNLPDFTLLENIQNRAAEIKSRTQSGNMPRGRTLTQEQIDLIACWVDDGALDN